MQPEISHRCESCGASIREQAMFCPECGQALMQPPSDSAPSVAEETPAPAVLENSASESPAVTSLETSNASTNDESAGHVDPASAKPKSEGSAEKLPEQRVGKSGTYGKARDSLHRASTATREALADNVKRVEKIRHVSTAMIEEASYDPSLRFVLVALALFVVFLVLLLLSKVMG
jgi:predicted  nucleic acid-binding Zn-ribbon protein